MNAPLEKNQAANQSTLQQIPLVWVERIMQHMKLRWGAKFTDQWRGIDPDILKQAWSEEMAGYTADEIRRGLDACKTNTFPPSLPEFMALCRPPLNAESAYYEAVTQIQKREAGTDTWSHPAIYWTAAKIGAHDLKNNPWATIKGRWSAEFERILSAGIWPEIPPHREALPAPGMQSISREEASKRVAEIGAKVQTSSNAENPRAWAEKIFERYANGETLPDVSVKFAEEALGRARPERIKRELHAV